MSDTIGGSNFGTSNTVGGSNISDHRDHRDGGGDPPLPLVLTHFSVTVGDGVTLVFPITHNLGTQDTTESVYLITTLVELFPPAFSVQHTSANVTTFTFLVAPALNSTRITIHV